MAPRVISFAMQKGGAGKTTVCTNVAGALAGYMGKRVLVVDCDIQCNTTLALLGESILAPPTVHDVLWAGLPMAEARRQTPYCERLFVVPGSKTVAQAELEVPMKRWDMVLAHARQEIPETFPDDVDYILWDLPPSLGLWTQAALVVSDAVVVVTQPEYFAYEGFEDLKATVANVRATMNPNLSVAGIVVGQVDQRRTGHRTWINGYREEYDSLVFEATIPEIAAISDAPELGQPVEFLPNRASRGVPRARATFREIAEELVLRTSQLEEVA